MPVEYCSEATGSSDTCSASVESLGGLVGMNSLLRRADALSRQVSKTSLDVNRLLELLHGNPVIEQAIEAQALVRKLGL